MGGGARAADRRMTVSVRKQIEPATENDVAEIVEIERACFSDPWSSSAFTSALREAVVYFQVIRAEGRVVGYVVAWFVADEGEIANLAVTPTMRRRGLAAALLDETLHEAERRGVANVYLEVRDSNDAARALYASRGFDEVGRRRKYYRMPAEDAVVLRRAATSGLSE
jgi:ribosomal-protein-alanine N-acetyltransferase